MTGNFDAVLFDMDGVTVATAAAWRDIEREEIIPAATAGGIPDGAIRALSPSDAYDKLVELDSVTLRVDRDEFLALFDQYADDVYQSRADLMNGYGELLSALRSRGLLIGLVSASSRDWVEMVLDRFELHDRYDIVVSSSDIDGPSKPDPLPYLDAARGLSVDPERCLVVEDSTHGIEAATEAGMYCIALRGAGNSDADLSRADEIVGSPRALRDAIFANL